jgi:molecular chaperone GrpE
MPTSSKKTPNKKQPTKSRSSSAQSKSAQSTKLDQLKENHIKKLEQDFQIKLASSESELMVSQKESEDWKNKCIRLTADLQNISRQNELDTQQARKNSKKSTIQAILPFLNTLSISFQYKPKTDDQAINTYISTLQNSFTKLKIDLATSGIEVLECAVGTDFDAAHMTILNSDIDPAKAKQVVKQVVSLGLRVDGQLVQPIAVIIE